MNIDEISAATGLPPILIRGFQVAGLLGAAARRASGHHVFSVQDVRALRFIKCARGLGLSMRQIKQLLLLRQSNDRRSADVKALALRHIAHLERKIEHSREMAVTLRSLTRQCQGSEKPDCSILQAFSPVDGPASSRPRASDARAPAAQQAHDHQH